MENNRTPETGFLPVCPFEGEHPEMLLGTPERDRRFDAVTGCEYTDNNEFYD